MNFEDLQLRIVRSRDVLLHEQVETLRVEKLTSRLQTDWFLKNPPITAQTGDRYILLDGATRVTALRRLECRDVVVQVVNYEMPGLVLETWNHILADLAMDDVFRSLRALPDLRLTKTTRTEAEDALIQRKSIGTILLVDGQVFSLISLGDSSLSNQARLLNGVVAAYEGRGEMYRVAHSDLERLCAENSRMSALIVFPRYRPGEIQHLALNGSKLPTGITRHIIPGRVMRINIPLDVLRSDEPLEKKNEWLAQWVRIKMSERHVRYYQEPVFLFDE